MDDHLIAQKDKLSSELKEYLKLKAEFFAFKGDAPQSMLNRLYYLKHKETIAARAKAYYQANRESIAAKSKVYREVHKETIAARAKAYYEANKEAQAERRKIAVEKAKITMTCECGSTLQRGAKSKHLKSKKHLKFTATQSD